MLNNTKIAIYQTPDGQTSLDVKLEDETVWLSQMQTAELFQKVAVQQYDELKSSYTCWGEPCITKKNCKVMKPRG